MSQKPGFDDEKAGTQSSEICIDVIVSDSGLVFAHLAVPDPVAAYLTAAPVSACKFAQVAVRRACLRVIRLSGSRQVPVRDRLRRR